MKRAISWVDCLARTDVTFNPQREARAQRSGHQQGDPAKAAKAMLRILEEPNPPAHLLLGTDAVKYASDKLSAQEFEVVEAISHLPSKCGRRSWLSFFEGINK
jgi:hypothetical protein